MSPMLTRATAVLVILALALFTLPGCEKPQMQPSARRDNTPIQVRLENVRIDSVQQTVDVVGSLWGNEETTISAKVAGRIAEIHKDVGDPVQPDELLAQIEKTDYELAVSQKDLALREALAKLGLQELPGPDFKLEDVPTVQRAKLQMENADAKLERGRKLHEQVPPLISDQDFADLKTAAAVAQKNYDVELLSAATAVAQAKARKADLDVAKRALADSAVRAPGIARGAAIVVAQRLVAVGEYVKEGTPLFRLVEVDPVKLRALVPEKHAGQVQVGQKVRVNVEAFPDDFWGTVTRTSPQVDQANRTFVVEALIPSPKRLLKPGGFARASIHTHVDPKVVFVPENAVRSFAGVSKVFVIREGKAAEIVVQTGRRQSDLIEIVQGLSGNEAVIITESNRLASGVPVVVGQAGPG